MACRSSVAPCAAEVADRCRGHAVREPPGRLKSDFRAHAGTHGTPSSLPSPGGYLVCGV